MKGKRLQAVLVITMAAWAAMGAPATTQAENTNTTVQNGKVCINRTFQSGDNNANSTYQDCKVNINRTGQIGKNNINRTAQFGDVNRNRASQVPGHGRPVYRSASASRQEPQRYGAGGEKDNGWLASSRDGSSPTYRSRSERDRAFPRARAER
jgi:hypothetical protein